MASVKNPFSHSEIATNDLFVGREGLIDKLVINIDVCHNVTVYGNRRVGKSSLIHEAINQYQKKNKKAKHLFIVFEMSDCTSSQEFVKLFANTISKSIKSVTHSKLGSKRSLISYLH